MALMSEKTIYGLMNNILDFQNNALCDKDNMYMYIWGSDCANVNSLMFGVLVSFGLVSLGGLGVTCSPRDPRFASLNPTEVDGFFQDVKILSTSPPGGT